MLTCDSSGSGAECATHEITLWEPLKVLRRFCAVNMYNAVFFRCFVGFIKMTSHLNMSYVSWCCFFLRFMQKIVIRLFKITLRLQNKLISCYYDCLASLVVVVMVMHVLVTAIFVKLNHVNPYHAYSAGIDVRLHSDLRHVRPITRYDGFKLKTL